MRNFYKIPAVMAFFCLTVLIVKADVFDDITGALKSGNAHEIARFFDSNVEMMTSDKSSVYSRNQAEMVLSDFLGKNQPKSFSIIHRGSSSKGAQYAIGTMDTQNGSFRVYLYVNEVNGKYFLQEIRFEKS
jgi:hypothetical protein